MEFVREDRDDRGKKGGYGRVSKSRGKPDYDEARKPGYLVGKDLLEALSSYSSYSMNQEDRYTIKNRLSAIPGFETMNPYILATMIIFYNTYQDQDGKISNLSLINAKNLDPILSALLPLPINTTYNGLSQVEKAKIYADVFRCINWYAQSRDNSNKGDDTLLEEDVELQEDDDEALEDDEDEGYDPELQEEEQQAVDEADQEDPFGNPL